MVPDSLTELLELSNQLATLRGKPMSAPRPVPEVHDLHPDLAELICSGALALKREGVDIDSVADFTERAQARGMRRKVRIFGWKRDGTTWYATPVKPGKQAKVFVIDRMDRLATTELNLAGFVDHLIEMTRTAVETYAARKAEREAAEAEEAARKEAEKDIPFEPKLKGRRPARVVIADSKGAVLVVNGKEEAFTGPELGYILWCLDSLEMVTPDIDPPDLSRWEHRAMRKCRLNAVPEPGTADHEAYEAEWQRLTRPDRATPSPVSYQLPSWKLNAPGSWFLSPSEDEIMRRAEKARPPRHTPTKEQLTLWKRFLRLMRADGVELRIL